jgi:RNA polymerase sigma factor (sigma-70 family)
MRREKRNNMTRRPDQILDEALVLHAQQGRREALDRLAGRWRARHYVHARRLLGSSELAADAVQDAWICIIRGLWRLRDPGHFPAWSYAIVTRRAQDLLRRVARAKESPLAEDIEDELPKDPFATDKLGEGLKLLPLDQRTAIALFYRDELTVTEIAEALAIPIGTVKTRLFHARRTLRRHLAGDES